MLLQEKERQCEPFRPMIIQMPGKQKDNGMIVSGKIPGGMIGPGTLQKSPIQPRDKGKKGEKGKRKGKYRND